jgi:ribose transport system substrate-binding protein
VKTNLWKLMSATVVLALLVAGLAACGGTPAPTATTAPAAPTATTAPAAPTAAPEKAIKIVVIGKSVHPYWSNVEKGVNAAGADLGVEVVFFVPPQEDVAAQIQTMQTYIAQGVTGIAIAPSDPSALEPVMKQAADAGIFVTTLDTPPVEDSVSLVYIGTDNFTAGEMAGEKMAELLPNGGTVGIGRGSDTALNALQRTDGFLKGIEGTDIEALEPVNDKEDAATALQLANSVISANPDLAGAFGVYAYNGPAWATAIKEANKVGVIKLVSFDATTDIINGIKEGVIDATIAQREYDMGYKSVEIIKLMAEEGVDAALSEMGAVDGVIDTGVDVITAATLKDYEAMLDSKGIPHEWNTEGWEAPEAAATVGPIKIVVIGKSVHPYWSNVEKGVNAAGADLGVEVVFFVPPQEDVAAQIQTMQTYIAQGVTGIAIAPSDPNALEPVMKQAADAGIFVTTLDTPPVEDSVSLVYIGTDNFTAGEMAGEKMAELLPNGGTVGIGRGSDTALNALQRTDGFLKGIEGTDIEALEPVNDKEDAATALQLANSVISANPDLAGAFGVYAYNGPAWATAIKEANKVGVIKLVSFDATTDIINGIKEGVIDATIAQREYDMGYKSVEIIKLMAEEGVDAALSEMGAVDGVIDTGVDVITAATLKDYEAMLDSKGIPHEWNTEGWQAP